MVAGTTVEPRFSLLETIREFGLERLAENGEIDATRRIHAAFYLTLAERASPELTDRRRGPGSTGSTWS